MYVFYEHTRTPDGAIVLTELKLSSFDNKWDIAFYKDSEKAAFQALNLFMKRPDASKRSCDMNTYIWTYLGSDTGPILLEGMKAVVKLLGGTLECIEVHDLQTLAVQKSFDYHKVPVSQRPEDFFHNYGAIPSTPAITRDMIERKLLALMEVQTAAELTKKQYFRSAMRLHPDRNNGDGSRMSDLNMYWRLYNG